MKNHELLDVIGEVNEDYVRAANDNVVRPRFRWKTFAAVAACAALVLAAYPVYRAANPPLHGYTVMEGGGDTLTARGDLKAPAAGTDGPIVPGGTFVGGEDTGNPDPVAIGSPIDGEHYEPAWQDAPNQDKAVEQYDRLIQNLGVGSAEDRLLSDAMGKPADVYPDWFGGAWIDNSYYPEAKLAVAIVDGFRTAELEAQLLDWCGGEVAFRDAKYSQTYLDSLMDPVTQALSGTGMNCGIGVDVMENCLGVDIYSNGAAIPDRVLADLAKLDPDGDAIRVRLFTQAMSTLTDEVKKAPAPGGMTEPVFDGARAEPRVEDSQPAAVPGGAT